MSLEVSKIIPPAISLLSHPWWLRPDLISLLSSALLHSLFLSCDLHFYLDNFFFWSIQHLSLELTLVYYELFVFVYYAVHRLAIGQTKFTLYVDDDDCSWLHSKACFALEFIVMANTFNSDESLSSTVCFVWYYLSISFTKTVHFAKYDRRYTYLCLHTL